MSLQMAILKKEKRKKNPSKFATWPYNLFTIKKASHELRYYSPSREIGFKAHAVLSKRGLLRGPRG